MGLNLSNRGEVVGLYLLTSGCHFFVVQAVAEAIEALSLCSSIQHH